jgi:hypothetical protein
MSVDLEEIRARLEAPMPFEVRPQAVYANKDGQGYRAQALGYIHRSDVMSRLDGVLGIGGWRDEYSPIDLDKKVVECRIGLRIEGEWVYRADVGNPGQSTDENAWKGSYSDALKRAATHWGVGRFIYDLGKLWLPCDAVPDLRKQGKFKFKAWQCDPAALLLADARKREVAWALDYDAAGVRVQSSPPQDETQPQRKATPASVDSSKNLEEDPVSPAGSREETGGRSPLATLETLLVEKRLSRKSVAAYCSQKFKLDRPSLLSVQSYEQLLTDIREGKVAAKAA